MKKINISAALATFNEENNIIDCINSLKTFTDEIVVVDGSSTDRTSELAKKNGAKVITTTNKTMFHINKNLAIKNCKGDWILLVDADERVDHELAKEIKATVAARPSENGFWINRRNWFLGGFLKKGGAYPDSVIRLFRKGKGILPQISVHEQVKIEGSVGYLKHDLLHFAYPSFVSYLERANRYSKIYAAEIESIKPSRGAISIVNYTLVKPVFTFMNLFIRHRGYIDGFRGFAWAFFSATHHYLAFVAYFHSTQTSRNHLRSS